MTIVTGTLGELSSESHKAERQKARRNKREAATEGLQRVRRELFAGGFDGLVYCFKFLTGLQVNKIFRLLVCSEYDSISIIQHLIPFLAGSSSIAIQSPHIQVSSGILSLLRLTSR